MSKARARVDRHLAALRRGVFALGACVLSPSVVACDPLQRPAESSGDSQKLAASMHADGTIDVMVSMEGVRFEPVRDSDVHEAVLVSQSQGPPLSVKLRPTGESVVVDVAFRREGSPMSKVQLLVTVVPGTPAGTPLSVMLR